MQVSKHWTIGFLLLFMVSCIESFHPKIEETQDLLVINGRITDQRGEHFVEVSRSSPFNQPGIIPVGGCVVFVEDNNGRVVTYSESKPGIYTADLDESFLGVNKTYRLYVSTPDGKEYHSEYDSLLICSPLDSLYFEVEMQETNNPDVTYYGIRFLVDIKGHSGESRNFLWKLEETYEYHSWYPIQFFWDGVTLHEYYSNALYTCYRTQPINELYTASTRYLIANELNKFPLTWVSNKTDKLKIKYSLLVVQHSLSNDAFLYWEKMENQLSETGGLYEKQPSSSVGNIFNINDKNEKVLGYFYASQVKEKRIMVRNTFGFPFTDYTCLLDTAYSLNELAGRQYYLISFSRFGTGPPYGYGNKCFDCRMRGGTTSPPGYWNIDE